MSGEQKRIQSDLFDANQELSTADTGARTHVVADFTTVQLTEKNILRNSLHYSFLIKFRRNS